VWKAEKATLQGATRIKEQIEAAKLELEAAQRGQDYARMSEIQYGTLPELEKQLKAAQEVESKGFTLLQDKVTAEEIAQVVSRWTGIPVSKMLEGEREKLLQMEAQLHTHVVGQDEAIKVVADAVRRSRAGLSDPDRPSGSFLFLGPTRVGKTELSKALADFLFDSADAMVRIDMSEFMEKHSVARLIGAPPGYVGYEDSGTLTKAVRRKPYSVVLLDEIEKAHPDVFNILLQVLDEGHLTDNYGRIIDFKNTVVIMTSNVGARDIMSGKTMGFHGADASQDFERMQERIKDELNRVFNPEFLNRLDDIIVFHPLDREHISRIVTILLREVQRRLGDEVRLTPAALDFLVEKGYDQNFGARPLRRAIQRHIEDPLSEKILLGEIGRGDEIEVDVSEDKERLVFRALTSQKA
jgi:ATP-dependent Clp protease ATP-binding subunit ClpB